MAKTNPFKNNRNPDYRMFCPMGFVDSTLGKIRRRLPRCLDHGKGIALFIVTGDPDTGLLLRLTLREKGFTKIDELPRSKVKKSKLKNDVGNGPVLRVFAENSELPRICKQMKVKLPEGTQVAEAAVSASSSVTVASPAGTTK